MGPKIQNRDYLKNRCNNVDEVSVVYRDSVPQQNCIDGIFWKMTVHTVGPIDDFAKTSRIQSDGFIVQYLVSSSDLPSSN